MAGTPGTWKQILPAAVTADPASGTIPTGYLILNVTQGTLKRHAGGYSWESIVGAAGGKIGFYGVTPVVQPAGADQAAVTLGNADGEIGGPHHLRSAHAGRGSGAARQVRGTGR